MTARITRLEEIADANAQAFSDAIQMLEVRTAVIQRVLRALPGGSTIDFVAEAQTFLAEVQRQEEEATAKAAEPAAPPSGIVVPDADTVHMFGGGG